MKKWKFVALVGLLFIFIGIFVQRKETIITYANFFLSKSASSIKTLSPIS